MNKITYGVKQLIMINSGTVEYLRLNLSLPLHLNAENNIGKTSTVNTLQFLYIDSMKDMALPTSEADSCNFYFRDEYSYLIFECVSQTGTYCVILNRPAESRTHFNRYVIRKSFEETTFIKNDAPMDWSDVAEKLSEQSVEYSKVKKNDWWRVLSGLTEKNKKQNLPALFILPVKDDESYGRFKIIYRYLLSMSNIKLDAFKDILLSCAVASGEKRKIDFAEKDYKTRFAKCRSLQQQQDYYRTNEIQIVKLQQHDKDVKKFQKSLPAIYAELKWNYDIHYKDLNASIPKKQAKLEILKVEISKLTEEHNDIITQQGASNANLRNVQKNILEFEKLEQNQELYLIRERYQTYNELELHSEKTNEEYFILNENLKDIKKLDKLYLENSIGRIKKDIDTCKKIINNDDLLYTWLLSQGFENKDLSILSAFFNKDILTTKMLDIDIKDKDKLLNRLKHLTKNVKNDLFADDAISMPIKTHDFSELTDRDNAKRSLKNLEFSLKDETRKLKLYSQEKENIEKCIALENYKLKLKEMLKLYDHFDELKIKQPEFKNEEKELMEKVLDLNNKLKKNESESENLDEEYRELCDDLSESEGGLSELIGNFNRLDENIQQHFPNILYHNVKFNKEEVSLHYVIDELLNCNQKVESLAGDLSEIQMHKSQILKKVNLFYDNENDWSRFIEENSDIMQAGKRVEKEWQTFFALAKNDFKILVQCVDSINFLLRSINKSFGQQRISNLQEIKVNIDRNEVYEKFREFTVDSDDLFVDTSKRNLYTGWLQDILSKYNDLRAEDMFHIQIEIANPNNLGENKNIISFDNESEGTNYTIKALLLSQLLKEQFKFGLGQENIVFHYYLDEIGQLDEENLSNIISQNIERNLIPITAAPRPVFEPLCHPECRLVTLREHKETKLTYIDDDRTFSAKINVK